ncbi:MAG: AAA family ATPase [Dysgonamonadaceae bacterium]|jgi:hypothetical protein|nr:AAA family ATPase [Dysgonamonadaceae bacterium]
MDSQKSVIFEIEELGAIRNSRIELKPFMIFSGESGLGKSYAAFLAHYYYVLSTNNRLNHFFESYGYNFDKLLSKKTSDDIILSFETDDLIRWINHDALTYLRFILGNEEFSGKINVQLPFLPKTIEYKCKEDIISVENETEIYLNVSINDKDSIRLPHFDNWELIPLTVLLERIIRPDQRVNTTFLLPPSRGALVGLTSSSQNTIASTAGMYQEFLSDMDTLEVPSEKPKQEFTSPYILDLLKEINKGEIKKKGGKLRYLTQGVDIPVTASASSIKEITPLSLLLNKHAVKNYSILFEEPEAHLHPRMQIKTADLIAAIVNDSAHFQITTHSDYLIRRINDLITLGKIQSHDKIVFEQICEKYGYNKYCALDAQKVGAYFLQRNADNTVTIIEQNMENGVPYDSFHDVVSDEWKNSMLLQTEYENLIENKNA